MTTTHRPFSFFGGDDWFINARLTDVDGNPYDLAALDEIRWLLHSPKGEIIEHEFLIRHLDASDGRLEVWLPNQTTTDFAGGPHTDFLRIVCDGIVSTLLTGVINVTRDPWRHEVQAATFMGFSSADVVVLVNEKERIERHRPRREGKVLKFEAKEPANGTG